MGDELDRKQRWVRVKLSSIFQVEVKGVSWTQIGLGLLFQAMITLTFCFRLGKHFTCHSCHSLLPLLQLSLYCLHAKAHVCTRGTMEDVSLIFFLLLWLPFIWLQRVCCALGRTSKSCSIELYRGILANGRKVPLFILEF